MTKESQPTPSDEQPQPVPTTEQLHKWGGQAIDALEKRFGANPRYEALTTAELAEFWQGMTEACVLRLVRLKPEMVVHHHDHD